MSGSRPFTNKQLKQRQAEEKSKAAGLAALQHEIFGQLMQIPQFATWFEKNVRIQHDVDQTSKTIDVKVIYIGDPEKDDDQEIVTCPGCRLKFDANEEAPQIQLAEKIPESTTPGGQ